MQMKTDGTPAHSWALRDYGSKVIDLTTICDSEDQADRLRRARHLHQAHRPECEVVEVVLELRMVRL